VTHERDIRHDHDPGLIHGMRHMARKDLGRRQTLRMLLSGASVALGDIINGFTGTVTVGLAV
jgi:hypothetical protein